MSTLTHSYHEVNISVVDDFVNVFINDTRDLETIREAKEIGFVSLTENGFHVEVYCFLMTKIYNELKKLSIAKEWKSEPVHLYQINKLKRDERVNWRPEQITSWKTILEAEMQVEEAVADQIVEQIMDSQSTVLSNVFLVVFSDPHADFILLKTGLELFKLVGMIGLSLGDITGPRGDKWGQLIPHSFLNETRNNKALSLVSQYKSKDLFLLKGNHDVNLEILDVALVITTSKWQILFQHAFDPLKNETKIHFNRSFAPDPSSKLISLASRFGVADMLFTIYSTDSDFLPFMHMRIRSKRRNCDPEPKKQVEMRASNRIKRTLRSEDTYNPFMFYGHEINAFDISSSIEGTDLLPMLRKKRVSLQSIDDLIDEEQRDLTHRILPFDGEDGKNIAYLKICKPVSESK